MAWWDPISWFGGGGRGSSNPSTLVPPVTTNPKPVDPNAPLSTLLPSAPTSYSNATVPGASSSSKLQYLSDVLGTSGTSTIGAGTSLLGKPLDYWQKLLQPPTRESLLEQEGPAVSSVVGQYATGKKNLTNLPRGGGTSAVAANLPFEESGAITGLLQSALRDYLNVLQPQAAAGIAGVGENLENLGLSESGLASGDLSTLISKDLTKRGQTLQLIEAWLASAQRAASAGAGG